ncbi:MAG: response regulator transcription factor [Bacteroidales bacterium]|nr:MAG: response regulator transcription factor [Bacteroidales bacterium]
MPKLSILIAEKSYLIRKGLVLILAEFPQVGNIVETDNEEAFISLVNKNNFQILFLNPSFIRSGKFHTTFEKIPSPRAPVLIGIISREDNKKSQIKFAETIGFDENKSHLLKKIENLILRSSGYQPEEEGTSELSEREKNILRHIALGFTNKEIGEKLYISAHTVITHRKNITRKLGIKSVSGLTVYAILNKIVGMDEIRL